VDETPIMRYPARINLTNCAQRHSLSPVIPWGGHMKRLLSMIVVALSSAISAGTPQIAFASSASSCESGAVISFINAGFDRHISTLLADDIAIADIDGAQERRAEKRAGHVMIERHFCHANAQMTDGKTRDLYYLIEKDMGFVGIGDNIEFCVSGLDPYYVYGNHCRSLK
jgi:hypothetical protein